MKKRLILDGNNLRYDRPLNHSEFVKANRNIDWEIIRIVLESQLKIKNHRFSCLRL